MGGPYHGAAFAKEGQSARNAEAAVRELHLNDVLRPLPVH